MDSVVISVGSNVGNRHRHLRNAHGFLARLSAQDILASPIYITEPVGPSSRYFLNAVIELTSELAPKQLLAKLKKFELQHGRCFNAARWSARTIDLDIITFGNLVIQDDSLIIPHPEYAMRRFVLEPLRDMYPNWHDPKTGQSISAMLDRAPGLQLKETALSWYGK